MGVLGFWHDTFILHKTGGLNKCERRRRQPKIFAPAPFGPLLRHCLHTHVHEHVHSLIVHEHVHVHPLTVEVNHKQTLTRTKIIQSSIIVHVRCTFVTWICVSGVCRCAGEQAAGSGGGGGGSGLSGGAIFGIILAVLVVVAVVGSVVAYRVSPTAKLKFDQLGLAIASR